MKKVFTHENRLIVFHIKNLLEEAGINCQIKNEYASGGVGDLSPFETWPEVWVSDEDAEQAKSIIKMNTEAATGESAWNCAHCGETNDANYRICWNCQHVRG